MTRRNFNKITTSLLLSTSAFAKQKKLNIKMQGELDDDLIIFKKFYSNNKLKPILCYQMHNFTKRFSIGSNVVKSIQIPGYINIDKTIPVSNDGIVCLFTANEREDFKPGSKQLSYRTHYKSSALTVNNKTFFKELLPEKQKLNNYPTWYLKEEDYSTNYYRIWENATVLNGFISHERGEHTFYIYNKHDELMGNTSLNLSDEKVKKIKFKMFNGKKILNKHIFTEINDFVFDGKNNTKKIDDFIKENAITKVIIRNKKGLIEISLPYSCPYINTFFIKGVNL